MTQALENKKETPRCNNIEYFYMFGDEIGRFDDAKILEIIPIN